MYFSITFFLKLQHFFLESHLSLRVKAKRNALKTWKQGVTFGQTYGLL